MGGALSPFVQQLLGERIEGYGQLEVLLLLQRSAPRSWTAEEAGAETKLPVDQTEEALASLVKVRLAGRSSDDPPRYGLVPQEEELQAGILELARAWEGNRLEVIEVMNAQAMTRMRNSALRTFSDAFRLREPKND